MHTLRIRRKITSSSLRITELKEFIGKQVEITVREHKTENNSSQEKLARGLLSDFKDPEKINEEKNAWHKAVSKKYGNS